MRSKRPNSLSGRIRAFICLCASTLALFFMMSNVLIFARQLYYLFWTLTALGMVALNAPATGASEAWDDESDPAEPEALEAGEPEVPEVDLLTRQQV